MGIEVVLNDAQFRRVGIVGGGEPVPEVGVVRFGALRSHLQVALPAIKVVGQQERTGPQPFILIVLFAHAAWSQGQRQQAITEQLTGQLIETQTRASGVGRLFLDIADICQTGNVLAIRLANAPFFRQPRLKFVFFRN